MMKTETILLVNSFSNWLAAVGTVSAVIVSLWLANNQLYFKVKAYLTLGVNFLENSSKQNEISCISIDVTNFGFRPVTITMFYWKLLFYRGLLWSQNPYNSDSDSLPKQLNDGDSSKYYIDWNVFKVGVNNFFPTKLSKIFPTIYANNIKLYVVTSIGKSFRVSINKKVKQEILKEYFANKTIVTNIIEE